MKIESLEQAKAAIQAFNLEVKDVFDYTGEFGEYAIFFENDILKGEYKQIELRKGTRTDLWLHRQYSNETEAGYFTERIIERYIANHEEATIEEVLAFAVSTHEQLAAIENKALNK